MLFQLNQLDEAKLIENEQAELEAELETLSHVEEIKLNFNLLILSLNRMKTAYFLLFMNVVMHYEKLKATYPKARVGTTAG